MLPEQEDVEWHSDRIALSADPDGLKDTRVSQLAADQVVLKHTWLLNADAHVKQRLSLPTAYGETEFMHANDQCHQ